MIKLKNGKTFNTQEELEAYRQGLQEALNQTQEALDKAQGDAPKG